MMPSRQSQAEQIRDANSTFMAELNDLEAQAGAMTAVPAGEVGDRLRSVRAITAEHFELEEQSGCLNQVAMFGSDSDVKRRSLLADHRDILHSLDELIGDADAGEGLTGDLRDRLQHWIRGARQHEERENAFFEEVREDEPC